METKHMLNLIDFEKHRLELFRQQTDTLDGLMPMFRVAANLILEEMEPFRKYGREPHLDLSTCSQYIRLRLTVQKKDTKAISYNWINVLYKPDGVGQVAFNADNLWQPVERDARQIAEQFCKAHRDMIRYRFELLLPV